MILYFGMAKILVMFPAPLKCNYDSVLIKVTCSGKVWGNGRFYEVSVITFCIKTRFFSFVTFKMNKVLNIS